MTADQLSPSVRRHLDAGDFASAEVELREGYRRLRAATAAMCLDWAELAVEVGDAALAWRVLQDGLLRWPDDIGLNQEARALVDDGVAAPHLGGYAGGGGASSTPVRMLRTWASANRHSSMTGLRGWSGTLCSRWLKLGGSGHTQSSDMLGFLSPSSAATLPPRGGQLRYVHLLSGRSGDRAQPKSSRGGVCHRRPTRGSSARRSSLVKWPVAPQQP